MSGQEQEQQIDPSKLTYGRIVMTGSVRRVDDVWRWMIYVGGRTRHTGRSKSSRRYFGIQVGSCAVLRRCIGTCLSELDSSTDTCRTSIDLSQMLFKWGILILCRVSSTFIFTRLRKTVGIIRHEICHDGWRMDICYATDGYHPQILPPIPGFPSRPANEEQIIAH